MGNRNNKATGVSTEHTFSPGDKVLYVPTWASGDTFHSDCEKGVIVRIEGDVAWVKYHNPYRYDKAFESPQRTALSDLRHRDW